VTSRCEVGDCRTILQLLPETTFRCCVTSPPYWQQRDYGHPDQLGLEATPEAFVQALVEVFREVRRTLTDDGTLWLNIGDGFFGGGYSNHRINGEEWSAAMNGDKRRSRQQDMINANPHLKPKDLIGAPWMLAFALRADGWYLRSDIIWHKVPGMPESVLDRPHKSHEHVFLLAKSREYFYDWKALAEPDSDGKGTRSARDVWTIAPEGYPGSHFATMPSALVQRCILAGSAMGDVILDPFFGSGTVGAVAESLGRRWFGCELVPGSEKLSAERTAQTGLPFR
jgi:site-specific DNA-methyltransferase (cytosine-N4-specific)